MTDRPSKYTVTEHPHGFTVQGPDRGPVTVRADGPVLHVTWPEVGRAANGATVTWPDLQGLVGWVAHGLMVRWQPPEHPRDADRTARGQEPWQMVGQWAKGQTAKALAGRIRDQWLRLRASAPADVLAVQWAIMRVSGQAPAAGSPAVWPDLYGGAYPWLVTDAGQYRAAAITVGWPPVQGTRADVLATMAADWQALYSYTGRRYTSLSRTLMQLPGRVPPSWLMHLADVALPRPITDRGPLLVALTLGRVTAERWPTRGRLLGWQPRVVVPEDVARPFLHCTVPQVRRVLDIAGPTMLGRPGRLAKARDVLDVTRGLLDYPEHHRGTIVGLARKAVQWHLAEAQARAERMAAQLGHDRPTATLPVPLPADASGITHLATVGDVCTEGARMQHCVGNYAAEAVQGGCYLFHVDWQGDQATVQIDRAGNVVQARGPRNAENTASTYGARVLGAWGRQAAQLGHADPPATWPMMQPAEDLPF